MTPKKPKFPEVFQSAEEEENAAEALCRHIENLVFVGYDASVTEVGSENGRYVKLEGSDSTPTRFRYLVEGRGEVGHWNVIVCVEGDYPNEAYSFERIDGDLVEAREYLLVHK